MVDHLPILVAEDEENDVVLLRHALRKTGSRRHLIVAPDGQEVISYLSGGTPYADRTEHPLPGLLLLDLKMPRKTGFEVLAWLQNRPELKKLPVVVFTSSNAEADRKRAKELGAVDYKVKPTDMDGLVKILQEVQAKWLTSTS